MILTGSKHVIDEELGIAAVKACEALNVEPHTRIRTYLDKTHRAKRSSGFGMVLDPLEQDWNDVRTFVVQEADAVVALLGGDGTHDSIQRALLAKKPVFRLLLRAEEQSAHGSVSSFDATAIESRATLTFWVTTA